MYLGNRQQQGPEPSVLRFTGQLTIKAHSTQLNPYRPQNTPFYDQKSSSHHQPVRQPQRPSHTQEEEHPSFACFHADWWPSFDRKDKGHNGNVNNQPRQESQEEEKESLSARVQKLEQALSENIKFINAQTLESFYHLRSQIFNRITAYDQSFHERTQKLASLENDWEEKSKQMLRKQENQIQQEGEKLITLRQQLGRGMKKEMEQLLEEERSQANKIRQQKFDELTIELEKHRAQRKQEIIQFEDQIQTLKQEEQNARDALEERIHLRIKDETEAVEVLNNKVADLQERNEGAEALKELKEIKRQKEREREIEREKEMEETMEKRRRLMEEAQQIQRKGESEKLVNMETPYISRFFIRDDKITLNEKGRGQYQVLLGVVLGRATPFVLRVRIISKRGQMAIGVVDQLTQKQEQSSSRSRNAVCYTDRLGGCIHYGCDGEHQYKYKYTGLKLTEGKFRMEVDLNRGRATFSNGGRTFTQESDILSQPHRQFVPFFQMCTKGTSVSWRIE